MAEISSPSNPLPPLPPPVGNKCCDACIAPQLAVPTNHKCYQCGFCLHLICSTIELEDTMCALGSDSVCHDCYGMMKQIQLLISSSQIPRVSSSILHVLIVIICYYLLNVSTHRIRRRLHGISKIGFLLTTNPHLHLKGLPLCSPMRRSWLKRGLHQTIR
jgi:hypothetical protein